MNNRIRQAVDRAMGLMAKYESVSDEALASATDKYAFYMERANALYRAGNSLVWAKHQLLAEEATIMAGPLPPARGTSNSLASLGELLPRRVMEIRAEIAQISKDARRAFDASNDCGAIAAEYIK